MSPVGIVSIALGVLVVCGRAPLVVAPAATLRWSRKMVSTNGPIRVFGAFMLLGVPMIWAGSSAEGGLAGLLFVGGLGAVAYCPLCVTFPGAFRALVKAFLPSDLGGSLIGWRIVGLAAVGAGVVLGYYGALVL